MASAGISKFCTQTGMINTDNTEMPAIGRFRCNPCNSGGGGGGGDDCVPVGAIIFYKGSYTGPITAEGATFAICDGTLGTPNLSERFIRGVGPTAGAVNTTGGSNTTDLNTPGNLMTNPQIPDHRHKPPPASVASGQPPFTYSGFMVSNPAPTQQFWKFGQYGGGESYFTGKANTHTQPAFTQTPIQNIPSLPAYFTLILLQRIS